MIVGLFANSVTPARAQGVITAADCTAEFPNCKVYVSAPHGATDSAPIELQLDGKTIQPSAAVTEAVGVVVAFALDEFVTAGAPNAGIRGQGRSGQPRFIEFRQSAINFFEYAEQQGLLNNLWLAAYRTGEPAADSTVIDSFPPIVDWVSGGQINTFFNEVSVYEPDPNKNTPKTPLYDLVRATLDALERVDAPAPAARHAVVFTDGFEEINTLGLDELIRRAQNNGIQIHTVMLGQNIPDLERTLQKMSQPTGGLFVSFAALTDMQPLWDHLLADVSQTVLTFPLSGSNVRQIQVTAGGETDAAALVLPPLAAPTITIVQPEANASISWNAEDSGVVLPVQIEISYPDGFGSAANRVNYVEYSIGNIVQRVENAPTEPYPLAIDSLTSGPYSLRVIVDDKFSGRAESAPVTLQLQVIAPTPIPPTATAAPTPTSAAQGAPAAAAPTATPGADDLTSALASLSDQLGAYGWVALVAVLGLVGVLLFALFRPRRKPASRGSFSSEPPNYGDATEPDDATEPASEAFPAATLLLMRGEGNVPHSIPLYRKTFDVAEENQWSIGRSHQENDVVIDSRRVSKVHATIIERNGQFRIRDEMSSGGTYVTSATNRVRRRLEPLDFTSLDENDVINFNSIAYRFEVDKGDLQSSATEPDLGVDTVRE
ncbi:MAG: FHA domain-containing protein [Caldilineaceae bacterium]